MQMGDEVILEKDRYRVVEPYPMARGAYGQVWRGERISDGCRVALKVPRNRNDQANMPCSEGQRETVRQKQSAEMALLAQITAPEKHGILPVLDQGEWWGNPVMVMPLADGSLEDVRAGDSRFQRTGPQYLTWLHQVATALDRLHRLPARDGEASCHIHRDLKPANVLLHGGHAHLADSPDQEGRHPLRVWARVAGQVVEGAGVVEGMADGETLWQLGRHREALIREPDNRAFYTHMERDLENPAGRGVAYWLGVVEGAFRVHGDHSRLGMWVFSLRSQQVPGQGSGAKGGGAKPGRGRVLVRAGLAALAMGMWLKEAMCAPDPEPLVAGHRFKICDVCPEMVWLPTGEFPMGSPAGEEGRDLNEGPVPYPVKIDYLLAAGVYEVTFAEWDACVAGGGCQSNLKPVDHGWGRRPVTNVSWNDVQEYVDWLNSKVGGGRRAYGEPYPYRLPTEAEWEYATRGMTQADQAAPPFHFGTITSEKANYNGKEQYAGSPQGEFRRRTVEVDLPGFPANEFGLFHVHGNVWEWVADCYADDAYEKHKDYPRVFAKGDGSCRRTVRGGSWHDHPRNLRAAMRVGNLPSDSTEYIGFRLVYSPYDRYTLHRSRP